MNTSRHEGEAGTDPGLRVEQGRKRVRAYLAGALVVDTTRPLLVWEVPYYPTYYFPSEDVVARLVDTGTTRRVPGRGVAEVLDVVAGGTTAAGAAQRRPDPPVEALKGAVRLEWSTMTEWLEEDEPVYVHPRNPYTRVDILASSRHVRVELDGVTLADSHRPRILFETGLPPRYYLPLTDVRMELLRPSPASTACPYKGTASYWSVVVNGQTHDNLVWTYRTPLPESRQIAGLACFYDERVDRYVDGVRQERPRTHFRPPE